MGVTADDFAFMARALRLAEQGLYTATPNPRVGCLIARDGEVVGEGWHRRAGEPHAEVHALAAAGSRARDATVYVTLEPCTHHGRTPPCVDALIAAQVKRVVAAMQDPNPQVSGSGIDRLRAAGIEVEVGVMEAQARELNIGFVARMNRGRPWLRLKIAAALDGRTALDNGVSQWITGPGARRDAHHWRARSCAVMTGIGTLRDDDPRLNVREVQTTRQPLRIVVDSRLRIRPEARIFGDGGVLVATATQDAQRIREVRARGADIVILPNAQGKVDLERLAAELAGRGINEVTVEAGVNLNSALHRAGLVDELVIYYAPMLLGAQGRGILDLEEVHRLEDAPRLEVRDLRHVGADLRVIARFRR
ncbi:MAG TPA: bifunctional diaminohydroxyphosphoribosylaminopyrimidine deaminase/5-amino-6-(5-phosphoribosylamino)uracil reductase RibD [Burkholderiales bacterium]|jgi:diaminohydroxyphosphoribosylaminopyrimidine deaminase/5-amino-6-(5-phosphoribosylamino)uracil reductase|nr:bifunctional diaminohydroxyphosphoribosylaminopyrimidine deaminase/5-amino-6-(5-phosphoribosylamino)uracil reductase RibD [Burkholderiales bacterium]